MSFEAARLDLRESIIIF